MSDKREILFRGKRADNGRWIEGYHGVSGGSFILIDDGITCGGFEMFGVIPETVCQYTGLTDKNGRKIFEGDTVEHDMSDTIGIVKWYCEDYVGWCADDIHIGEQQFTDEMWNECEVIGNIFDDPGLAERCGEVR